MRSSYKKEDVTILLKDITGLVQPQPTEEREKAIQTGRHYSEMLPIEYAPSKQYMEAYEVALKSFGQKTADAVAVAAKKILAEKGSNVTLVSLARAGIPVGILLKRYMAAFLGTDPHHYAVSIIRDRGIDTNAMTYILKRHKPENLQFVDGWIGKGAILRELEKDLTEFPGVSPELAVLADPAHMTSLCGTHEDILIPSSCLNSTVSGLISRTFLRSDIIGPEDFHGAVYYGELAEKDLSSAFLEAITSNFRHQSVSGDTPSKRQGKRHLTGLEESREIADAFNISDINLIKPGIGEATRVLLRRVPWKILIRKGALGDASVRHLQQLAAEKAVDIEEYPLQNYIACGIIRKLKDV